jgi:hypothetical protein|tara:strand:+ start:147 stop:626 length:480 start_codon:yes stop_codon:yes gene_type:complete
MNVIDNFLPEDVFLKIKNDLLSLDFPWYYSSAVASDQDDIDFYFNHNFYEFESSRSSWCHKIVNPLLGKLTFNNLVRARANLYTRKTEPVPNGFHIDQSYRHTVALFTINTNNGYTLFKDGTKHPSVENTMLLFDGSLEHASVAQTDEKVRVNINLNLI